MFFFCIYSDRNGGGSDVYEGTAEISPGEWTKIYFDISQAAESYGTVDHMTVWVKDGDGNRANAEYSLLISELDAYKKDMSKLTAFCAGNRVYYFSSSFRRMYFRSIKSADNSQEKTQTYGNGRESS